MKCGEGQQYKLLLIVTICIMPISIAIPFYNAENFLADSIRSVFAQTYQDWELILVDDGSIDRSLEIAMSVKDSRVRVLSDSENKKLPYRLNQITSEAKYNFIGRMDADDLISPTRFEKQMAVMKSHPEVDLVTTGIFSIKNDLQPIGVRCAPPNHEITGRKLLLGCSSIVHAAILGRKEWFLRNRYDPWQFTGQDYELWLRAYSKYDLKIYVITEPLYYYREENNVVAAKMLKTYQSGPRLLRKYGHLGFGRLGVASLIMRSYSKIAVVRMLSAVNRLDLLLKRRSSHIVDPVLLDLFHKEIQQIKQTRVPGLD